LKKCSAWSGKTPIGTACASSISPPLPHRHCRRPHAGGAERPSCDSGVTLSLAEMHGALRDLVQADGSRETWKEVTGESASPRYWAPRYKAKDPLPWKRTK
jgi:hypothetical protein